MSESRLQVIIPKKSHVGLHPLSHVCVQYKKNLPRGLKLHNCFAYFNQKINPWRMVFYFTAPVTELLRI